MFTFLKEGHEWLLILKIDKMKNSRFDLKHLVLIMASIALFSCSKDAEVGPIGPQGEQGIQGPAGQDGANGQDGADGQDGVNGQDGADGNANVIVSDWIDTAFSVTANVISTFDINMPNTNINGATLVYGRVASGIIYPLPHEVGIEEYTYYIEPSTGTFPNFTPNKMGFVARTNNNTDRIFDEFEEVRYVNIPPQTSGKSAIDFEKMTYEEVMDHFGMDY